MQLIKYNCLKMNKNDYFDYTNGKSREINLL